MIGLTADSAGDLSFYPKPLSPYHRRCGILFLALSTQPRRHVRFHVRPTCGVLVTTISLRSEVFARGARMLRTTLGPAISGYLEDPSVVEVMLNPDDRLWIDRLSGGL